VPTCVGLNLTSGTEFSISSPAVGNSPQVAPLTGQSPCIVGIGLSHALWGVTSALLSFYCLFACLSYLSAGTHYDRLGSDGRSTSALVYIKSLWVRGRRRGHHPAPHRMPFNKRSFFLAATAIKLALLLGYGRSQYTGNCTNVINTTRTTAQLPSLGKPRRHRPVPVGHQLPGRRWVVDARPHFLDADRGWGNGRRTRTSAGRSGVLMFWKVLFYSFISASRQAVSASNSSPNSLVPSHVSSSPGTWVSGGLSCCRFQ